MLSSYTYMHIYMYTCIILCMYVYSYNTINVHLCCPGNHGGVNLRDGWQSEFDFSPVLRVFCDRVSFEVDGLQC